MATNMENIFKMIGSCKECDAKCFEDSDGFAKDSLSLFDTGMCLSCETDFLKSSKVVQVL